MSDDVDRHQVPVEPSADQRRFARTMYAQFVALTRSGFTESQALMIIGSMITGASASTEGLGD